MWTTKISLLPAIALQIRDSAPSRIDTSGVVVFTESFPGRILVTDIYGREDPARTVTTVGYSPLAALLMAILGAMAIFTTLAMGARTYKGQIPLAASCSLAIAAACHDSSPSATHPRGQLPPQAAHPPASTEDMSTSGTAEGDVELESLHSRRPPQAPSTLPVRWGETVHTRNAEIGHCCFSSERVMAPLSGRLYAGDRQHEKAKEIDIPYVYLEDRNRLKSS